MTKAKYKKLRTLEDKNGMIYIQEYKYFLWWTVLSTYSYSAARSFLNFSGLEYDEKTGNYI